MSRPLRAAARCLLVIGLFTGGAHAQTAFPNIDRAQNELASAEQHADAAWRNNGPRFGGHLAAALDHMRAARAELGAAVRAFR